MLRPSKNQTLKSLGYALQATAMANATLTKFSKHPKMDGNLTLSSDDPRTKPKELGLHLPSSSHGKCNADKISNCPKMDGNLTLSSDRPRTKPKRAWDYVFQTIAMENATPPRIQNAQRSMEPKHPQAVQESKLKSHGKCSSAENFKIAQDGWEPDMLRPSKKQTPEDRNFGLHLAKQNPRIKQRSFQIEASRNEKGRGGKP
jgi:hypothetical protein